MVTLPGGRLWSFCCWAAVFGVITLKPEATSMFSLFCVLPVVAQLTNNAAPAAILLSKIDFNGFILVIIRGFVTNVSERNAGRDLRAVHDDVELKVVILEIATQCPITNLSKNAMR